MKPNNSVEASGVPQRLTLHFFSCGSLCTFTCGRLCTSFFFSFFVWPPSRFDPSPGCNRCLSPLLMEGLLWCLVLVADLLILVISSLLCLYTKAYLPYALCIFVLFSSIFFSCIYAFSSQPSFSSSPPSSPLPPPLLLPVFFLHPLLLPVLLFLPLSPPPLLSYK